MSGDDKPVILRVEVLRLKELWWWLKTVISSSNRSNSAVCTLLGVPEHQVGFYTNNRYAWFGEGMKNRLLSLGLFWSLPLSAYCSIIREARGFGRLAMTEAIILPMLMKDRRTFRERLYM